MSLLKYDEYASGSHLLDNDIFLSRCQIDTPLKIIEFFWGQLHKRRDNYGAVVDLGAGDGRFANYGRFKSYVGYEIDDARRGDGPLPTKSKIIKRCAFSIKSCSFDACIGNPPYVRHHDLDSLWQEKIFAKLEKRLGTKLDRRINLFVLFMAQAISITKEDGIVAQIVPYEWVTRPATTGLREYIKQQGWNVEVYRFVDSVFPRVLTTSSITIIDKSKKQGRWKFFEINKNYQIKKVKHLTGSRLKVLAYTKRNDYNYAQRGLSPGSNRIFCLTEGERLHHGLKKVSDVLPCVTSIKALPDSIKLLTAKAFNKHYVDAGERCWLISNTKTPSKSLKGYLDEVPIKARDNYTCNNQTPWWSYKSHKPPAILYNSGFVKKAPQFVINSHSVIAVGSAFGIHNIKGTSKTSLIKKLRKVNFYEQLICYAKKLKRIEVNQMNTVIQNILNIK